MCKVSCVLTSVMQSRAVQQSKEIKRSMIKQPEREKQRRHSEEATR